MSIHIHQKNKQTKKKPLPKLKTHIGPHIIILGDFNTPLSLMDMSLKQNLKKDTVKLIGVMNQKNLLTCTEHFTLKQKNAP